VKIARNDLRDDPFKLQAQQVPLQLLDGTVATGAPLQPWQRR
jgi:hypothetical protein